MIITLASKFSLAWKFYTSIILYKYKNKYIV